MSDVVRTSALAMITRGQLKRQVAYAAPAYLKARVEKDLPLPQVVLNGTSKGESLVELVLGCVVDGGSLHDDMFGELMELMG